MKWKYIIKISTYSHLNINIYIKIYTVQMTVTVQMLSNFTIGKLVAKVCLKSFVFSK